MTFNLWPWRFDNFYSKVFCYLPWCWVFLLALLFLLMISYLSLSHEYAVCEKEHHYLNRKLQSILPEYQNFLESEKRLGQIKIEISNYKNIIIERSWSLNFLLLVSHIIPDGVWLNKVDYDFKKDQINILGEFEGANKAVMFWRELNGEIKDWRAKLVYLKTDDASKTLSKRGFAISIFSDKNFESN